ncbi:MAG: hypothetical protein ABI147_04200 [Acidobacteriaceae bacterium]
MSIMVRETPEEEWDEGKDSRVVAVLRSVKANAEVAEETRRSRRQDKQQVPFGNDRKKSKGKGKGNSKGNSRFPAGMTERKARAKATTTAGSLRE